MLSQKVYFYKHNGGNSMKQIIKIIASILLTCIAPFAFFYLMGYLADQYMIIYDYATVILIIGALIFIIGLYFDFRFIKQYFKK